MESLVITFTIIACAYLIGAVGAYFALELEALT